MTGRWHRYSAAVTRTRRWRALRLEALRRDGFRCVQCGGRHRLEVDHIKPVRSHPELSFDLGNLQTLDARCHAHKTRVDMGLPPTDQRRLRWRDFTVDLQTPRKEL